MIVRVLGEGRFEVPVPTIPALDRLYRDLVTSIRADDDAAFRLPLPSLLTEIRHRGVALPPGRLGVFDMLVPGKDGPSSPAPPTTRCPGARTVIRGSHRSGGS